MCVEEGVEEGVGEGVGCECGVWGVSVGCVWGVSVGCECKCVCGRGGMEENVKMESGCVPSAICPQMTCTIK